jgi:hypothetical protein
MSAPVVPDPGPPPPIGTPADSPGAKAGELPQPTPFDTPAADPAPAADPNAAPPDAEDLTPAGLTPEQAAEWATMRSALAKANTQAKNWREKYQGKAPGTKPVPTPPPVPAKDTYTKAEFEAAQTAAVERAKADAIAEALPGVVNVAARGLLAEAGMVLPKDPTAAATAIAAATRMMDLTAVELDTKTGGLLGLEEQVDALKLAFPQLFTAPPPVKKAAPKPGGAGGGGKPPATVQTDTEWQASVLFGNAD